MDKEKDEVIVKPLDINKFMPEREVYEAYLASKQNIDEKKVQQELDRKHALAFYKEVMFAGSKEAAEDLLNKRSEREVLLYLRLLRGDLGEVPVNIPARPPMPSEEKMLAVRRFAAYMAYKEKTKNSSGVLTKEVTKDSKPEVDIPDYVNSVFSDDSMDSEVDDSSKSNDQNVDKLDDELLECVLSDADELTKTVEDTIDDDSSEDVTDIVRPVSVLNVDDHIKVASESDLKQVDTFVEVETTLADVDSLGEQLTLAFKEKPQDPKVIKKEVRDLFSQLISKNTELTKTMEKSICIMIELINNGDCSKKLKKRLLHELSLLSNNVRERHKEQVSVQMKFFSSIL